MQCMSIVECATKFPAAIMTSFWTATWWGGNGRHGGVGPPIAVMGRERFASVPQFPPPGVSDKDFLEKGVASLADPDFAEA